MSPREPSRHPGLQLHIDDGLDLTDDLVDAQRSAAAGKAAGFRRRLRSTYRETQRVRLVEATRVSHEPDQLEGEL